MEIQYPKEFDTCPACGSKERVIKNETDKAIAEGKLKEGAHIPILQTRALIFDPHPNIVASKVVRAIFTAYDACANCGCLYVVHVTDGEATVEPAQQQKPFGHMPPFFGRG